MPRTPVALVAILVEAGLSHSRAVHLCRNLDRLRLSGLGSDDIADVLLKWAARKYLTSQGSKSQVVPVVHYDDVPGQMLLIRVRD